jgi:membrane protease YdiL (CAAX protease family)
MTSFKTFIKRYPVLTFYILVYAISWGGILLLIGGPGTIPGTDEQVQRLFFPALLAYFAGPSVAGILITGFVSGRAGFRDLLARLARWRVSVRWYAAALLPGPLLVAGILFTLSLFSPEFIPGIVQTEDKVGLLVLGIGSGLIGGGLLEELGWTGFAVARLRLRYDALRTGLIVGLLWGAAHMVIAFWASASMSGGRSLTSFVWGFLAFYLAALPAYRVLMVWVYDRTQSLLVAMLMHAILSASTIIFQPSSPAASLTWNLVLAAVLWIVVAAVAVANGGQLARQPLRRRMA